MSLCDVRITCSGGIPRTLLRLSMLQMGTSPGQVARMSPEQVLGEKINQNFLALLAPMECARGGYLHSRLHVVPHGCEGMPQVRGRRPLPLH